MKKIPEIRFPEFSGEWVEKKLGEVGEFYLGLTYTPQYVNNGVPFLSVKDIVKGKINFKNTKYINKKEFNEITENAKPKKDDVLFGRVGTLGNAVIVETNQPFAIFVSLGFIRVYKNYSNVFIKEWINSNFFKKQVNSLVGGSSQKNLNVGWLKKFKIHIPPTLEEQQKIADFLSSIDEKIEITAKKIEELKQYKKGLLQKMLNVINGEPEIRFKEFSGKWVESKLANVVEFFNGKAHEKDIIKDGKYIVINSKFISTNGNTKKYSNIAYLLAKKNDIAMVMSDIPNGKALAKCFYIDKEDIYTINQRICLLRVKTNEIYSKYLFYLLNRNKYYLKFNDGVNQTNLRKNDVLNCPILIPPTLAEQQKIAEFLSNIDKKIELEENKLKKIKEYKKGLLQKMFV
jgi:type I restriction enzyme S subunit